MCGNLNKKGMSYLFCQLMPCSLLLSVLVNLQMAILFSFVIDCCTLDIVYMAPVSTRAGLPGCTARPAAFIEVTWFQIACCNPLCYCTVHYTAT